MKLGILPACSHWVYVHGGGARPNSEEKSGVLPPQNLTPHSPSTCARSLGMLRTGKSSGIASSLPPNTSPTMVLQAGAFSAVLSTCARLTAQCTALQSRTPPSKCYLHVFFCPICHCPATKRSSAFLDRCLHFAHSRFSHLLSDALVKLKPARVGSCFAAGGCSLPVLEFSGVWTG